MFEQQGAGYPVHHEASGNSRLGDTLASLGLTAEGIDWQAPLSQFRLSSLQVVSLWLALKKAFNITLNMQQLLQVPSLHALEALIGQAHGQRVELSSAAPAAPAEKQVLRLTPVQQSYFTARSSAAGGPVVACNLYREFVLPGADVPRLEAAWQRLVTRQAMLRMEIGDDGLQRIRSEAPAWRIDVHDARYVSADALQARLQAVRKRLSQTVLGQQGRPYFALEATLVQGAAHVHLCIDGMLTDGVGLITLLRQWHQAYTNPEVTQPANDGALAQALLSLQARSQDSSYQDDLGYWATRLEGMPSAPDGLLPQPRPLPDDQATCSFDASIDARTWQALKDTADTLEVSPTALVLSVFNECLQHSEPARGASLVLTTNTRPWLAGQARGIVGPFTGSLVYVAEAPQDLAQAQARRTHDTLWADLGHASVDGVIALRQLRQRSAGQGVPALPVVFTSLLELDQQLDCAAGFEQSLCHEQNVTAGVHLESEIREQDGALLVHWDVDARYFPANACELLFARFINALSGNCAAVESVPGRALNPLQQAYWVARAQGDEGCQIYQSFRVHELDLPRLERALLQLVNKHEALRSFNGKDGLCHVLPPRSCGLRIAHIDLSNETDGAGALAGLRDSMAAKAFALGRWPQFDVRVSTDGGAVSTVHCAFDLALMDAVSILQLARQLMCVYDDPDYPFEPALDHAAFERAAQLVRTSPLYPTAQAYWARRLLDLPPGPRLAPAALRPGDRRRVRMEGRLEQWSRVQSALQRHGLSADALLSAAFMSVLQSWQAQELSLAVVRWNDAYSAYRPGEHSALSWLRGGHAGSLIERAARHQREFADEPSQDLASGLEHLRKLIMQQHQGSGFSLPVVYTCLFDDNLPRLPGGVSTGPWVTYTPDVSLDAISQLCDDTLFIFWDAVEGDFAPGQLHTMFAQFQSLLFALTQEEDWHQLGHVQAVEPVAAVLSARDTMLYAWNDTAAPYDITVLPYQLIEAQARARPQAIALRYQQGQMSHGELNRFANHIAWQLSDAGVGPETLVAISVQPSPLMVAAVLAIHKAGGAYLPLDPSLPQDRVQTILDDAGARFMIIEAAAASVGNMAGCRVMAFEQVCPDDPRALRDLARTARANSSAYIIYTSGSTGKPKGVLVAHAAVLNLLNWANKQFGFGGDDLGLAVASLGFDLSVFDLFGLLGSGGGLYIADTVERRDPRLLMDLLLSQPITFWNSSPAALHQLSPMLAQSRGMDGSSHLRVVFLSGDFTPLSLPDEVRGVFPQARIINLGGATEATVWSNFFPVSTIDPAWRSIPYGVPIDNSRYHVLDAAFEPCPVGCEGDLYIGGDCLSVGYWRRPELTAASFIPDRFSRTPGQRLYRTGDRAAYLPDGNLTFIGRVDNQVKIRGNRVELEEIDYQLRAHPAIKEALTLARDDHTGDRKLVAYLIAHGARPAVKAMREHVGKSLPSYMVPNFICFIDALPCTANGKVDRAALPWPLPREEALAEASEQPAPVPKFSMASLSEIIEALFAEQLSLQSVPQQADLWDLGASSFTMIQVANALQRTYAIRVPVSALVTDASVAGIARVLYGLLNEEAGAEQPQPNTAAQQADLAPAVADPASVDLLDEGAVTAFKARQLNLRPTGSGQPFIALPAHSLPEQYYDWRATQRDFVPTPITLESLSHLLSPLQRVQRDRGNASLYASAGSTYAVQCYLHIKAGAVRGVEQGCYYYHPLEHRLIQVCASPALSREQHFFYNRPLFDRAGLGLFLIGESKAIEPLYGDQSQRYLQLEAGHMAQLLGMAQAASGIGLCGIGALDTDALRAALQLSDSQAFLYGLLGASIAGPSPDDRLAPWFSDAADADNGQPRSANPEVAIIGVAGQFASAQSPGALWQCLRAGQRLLDDVPVSRDWAGQFPALQGGFMPRIDCFDHELFHISPREAATLDPQTRLVMHAVWACLEDAGYTPRSLREQAPRVGVVVAVMWHDYQQQGADAWREHGFAGVAGTASDIANRVSHFFDFNGPSLAVNTSCSSSLSALELAKNSLDAGHCDAIVVAAVNVISHPYHAGLLEGLNLLSRQAQPCAFDGEATGWTPGEGVSALLLRRPARQDHAYAIIEGCRVVHPGKLARYAAPDSLALATSLSTLLEQTGVAATSIDYVECAAAGASIADSAEIEALQAVFAKRSEALPVGTLKPNIGHLEAAAGLAQLTKVLFQMRHGELAPTLLASPQRRLGGLQGATLRVVEQVERWTGTRALISAVGASGTHAFAVLRRPSPPTEQPSVPAKPLLAVPLSAATAGQLRQLVSAMLEYLAGAPGVDLQALAFTLQTGRWAMAYRLVVLAESLAQLQQGLTAYQQGQTHAACLQGQADLERPDLPGALCEPRELGRRWVLGAQVDWTSLWHEQPRRMVALPTYPFAQHEHWLKVRPAPGRTAAQQADAAPELTPAVEQYLCRLYADSSAIPLEQVNARRPLEQMGLNSLIVTEINFALARDLGAVSRTLLFEHADLRAVAQALIARHAVALRGLLPVTGGEHPPATEPAQSSLDTALDVAIIGIAGRYPGADDLEQFWRNLDAGIDCIGRMPASRAKAGWPVERMWGGFLEQVDQFDPLFFNITPRDADLLDPQARLFLEVMWHTLEDAGYGCERVRQAQGCGVFVGSMYNEYHYFGIEQSVDGSPMASGSALADIANRVSYYLGATGPSMTVDTMCSSSLTALHLAIQSLRRGECSLALAGGVNLSLHPDKYIAIDRLKMGASDHRCRSFGAGGDGFVPGEGVGAVLLKPLAQALADGDRIHAVIKGSAINHGGRTNGYMVPNPQAHAQLIRSALRDARVEPASLSYIEAHGTGTALGDPVEVNGLTYAFEGAGLEPGACAIGSVKSQIGHLEAAAGIAGLTKLVLQMKHRRFAASLHAQQLNPNIDWSSSPLRVQRESAAWDSAAGAPLRAGLSSFGAGGANAHVVVEAYEQGPRPTAQVQSPQLIVLSAKTTVALRRLASRWLSLLEQPQRLADLALTSRVGRDPMKYRLALVVSELAELQQGLQAFLDEQMLAGVFSGAQEAASVTGQCPPIAMDRASLLQLARYWSQGGEVAWQALKHDPGSRITTLPAYPFDWQRCWLPEVPVHAPKKVSSGIALYTTAWRVDTQPAMPTTQPDGHTVCLVNPASVAIARQLIERLHPGSVTLLPMQPADVAGMRSVLDELLGSHGPLGGWIDLCDLDDDQAADQWLQRLGLLQHALAATPGAHPMRILHATRGSCSPLGEAPAARGLALSSYLRGLSVELSRCSLRCVDLDPEPGNEAANLLEQWNDARLAVNVCYRGAVRHLPCLEPVTASPARSFQPSAEGVYLITGGLRGLGAMIAREWVRRGARRLVLLGSSELPARAHWDNPGLSETLREAISNLRALEAAGAQVMTATAVLTDLAALQRLLEQVRHTLGPVRGVLHCAGNGSQGRPAFVHKSLDDIATAFAPKVHGLGCLAQALEPDSPEFFVAFSSVSALMPALAIGVSDYAAANACMDRLMGALRASGRPGWQVVNWPFWAESAGSQASREACERIGLAAISHEQGLGLLDQALALREHASLVALPTVPGASVSDLAAQCLAFSPVSVHRAPAAVATPVAQGPVAPWLAKIFSDLLRIGLPDLDPQAHFSDLGVESMMMVEIIQAIEAHTGKPLEPSALLDHPNLSALALHLGIVEEVQAPAAHQLAPASGPVNAELRAQDIAIIGMAGRFPDAADVDTFWRNLEQGQCAVQEVPASRWQIERFYQSTPQSGKSISKWGGFMAAIEDFDPAYFHMSVQEASECDPAIRIMLEESANCLSDAGYQPQELAGKGVGVYIGARMSGYRRRMAGKLGQAGLGGDQNFIAARIAHHFDLNGACMVVDTACSSALSALQLACQSLTLGESELALAGGVDILLDEEPYLEFSEAKALSPTGRCRTFDSRADGFVPGEGGGLVLLKRLDAALRDGDQVHAVIRAVASGNDGRTMGLTTPNPKAQSQVIRRALAASGLPARSIGMVEAHGTGTMIGDPIELKALTDVYREHTMESGFCAIGSVKSNIGHLLSAAGVAGLIKAVQSIRHGKLAPTLFCDTPNPRFDFERSPFFPNQHLRQWPDSSQLRAAALSAFGLGGTNVHMIISSLHAGEVAASPARVPLPRPVFRRVRCWLDAVTPRPATALSPLRLDFTAQSSASGHQPLSKVVTEDSL